MSIQQDAGLFLEATPALGHLAMAYHTRKYPETTPSIPLSQNQRLPVQTLLTDAQECPGSLQCHLTQSREDRVVLRICYENTFVGEMCARKSTPTRWEILKLKLFELHGKSTSASGQEDQNRAVAIKKINRIFRRKAPLGCSYLLGMASKAHRINLSFWLRHRSSTRRVFILWAVSLRNQSASTKISRKEIINNTPSPCFRVSYCYGRMRDVWALEHQGAPGLWHFHPVAVALIFTLAPWVTVLHSLGWRHWLLSGCCLVVGRWITVQNFFCSMQDLVSAGSGWHQLMTFSLAHPWKVTAAEVKWIRFGLI